MYDVHRPGCDLTSNRYVLLYAKLRGCSSTVNILSINSCHNSGHVQWNLCILKLAAIERWPDYTRSTL